MRKPVTSILVGSLAMLAPMACNAPRKDALQAPGFGPYSSAVLSGDFCFVSGKIGTLGGSFADEAQTAIDGVEHELARVGLGLADVVSATVYLTDMARYDELNAIYAERFPSPYPARACIAVKELPKGAQVEVQVVAHR